MINALLEMDNFPSVNPFFALCFLPFSFSRFSFSLVQQSSVA